MTLFKNNQMKYEIEILNEAKEEINKLGNYYQEILEDAYETMKNEGIEYLNINSLGNRLFEIKAEKTRSIFKYQKGQIIIICVVFLKKSQKTPIKILKLAHKRLNNK